MLRGMEMPTNVFEALTQGSPYKVQRLLRASEFADFCTKRDHPVTTDRLRKLEQLGLFLPLLRVRKPDIKVKIERIDEAHCRDLGDLQEDEVWTGEIRVELGQFDFHPEHVASWREYGLAWSPFDGPSEHDAETDTDPRRHEAYYSVFQIWDLVWCLSMLTCKVSVESALNPDGTLSTHLDDLADRFAAWAKEAVDGKDQPRFRRPYGLFAQLISDRFYPQTQSDGRLITISQDGSFHGWDWDVYARDWTPDAVKSLFGMDQKASEQIASQTAAEAHMSNPMDAWRDLTQFIAMERRKQLKGKALYAETLSEMARMHRLFHEIAYGEKLSDPRDTPASRWRGATSVDDDPYRLLELVANEYHLNPKPKLVLIVEGETEAAVIPLLFERWFGAPMARFGIQLRNMHGVGNATGGKKDVSSALWRIVDFLHAQQTIALVLFDREGLAAKNIGKGLREAVSVFFPHRRVTRRDYVKLWKLCFELDNFNNTELAAAMTELSGVKFRGRDLKPCRATDDKPVPLAAVYEALAQQPLDKVALGRLLIERLLEGPPAAVQGRPIVKFLMFAADRAQRNHQPLTEDIWEANQRSGWVGTRTKRYKSGTPRSQATDLS
jgi:hypothetical protein